MFKYLVFLFVSSAAIAATPATHSDSPDHAWYAQQYNLQHGSCCGLGDAYILEDDEWKDLGHDDLYQVKIDDKWYTIPAEKRRDIASRPKEPLAGTPAPSKKAVVWFDRLGEINTPQVRSAYGGIRIWCFSPWEDLY